MNVSGRGGEFYFQPCCRNVAETLRKGRERMPVEELLALQKKGGKDPGLTHGGHSGERVWMRTDSELQDATRFGPGSADEIPRPK